MSQRDDGPEGPVFDPDWNSERRRAYDPTNGHNDWSLFDDPPWDIQFGLPPGVVIDTCVICSGIGFVYHNANDQWLPRKIAGRVAITQHELCPCCGGTGSHLVRDRLIR